MSNVLENRPNILLDSIKRSELKFEFTPIMVLKY